MNRIINKVNILLLSMGSLFVVVGMILELVEIATYKTSTIETSLILSGFFLIMVLLIRVFCKIRAEKKQTSVENRDSYIDSIYDQKTKLYNRIYLKSNFREIFDKNPSIFKNCICVFIDVGNFKLLENNFGLDKADKTLKKLSTIISSSKREGDFAFRYSEQEMLIFYMNSDQEFVNKKLVELKEVFGQFTNRKFDQKDIKFTLSIGTAKYNYGEDLSDIIHRAHKAMYVSKYSGKDEVTNLN